MVARISPERATGMLLILLLISLIVTSSVGPEVDTRRSEFSASLVEIPDNQERYWTSIGFGLLSDLLTISLAGLLYLVLRPHGRSLALVGSFSLLAGAVTLLGFHMSRFGLTYLAEAYIGATGPRADTIESMARAFARAGDFGAFSALTLIALGLLSFGAVFIRSKALPRYLGGLAVVSGLLLPFFWLSSAVDGIWIVGLVGFAGTLLWQLLLGSWLLLKGPLQPEATGR